MITYKICYVTHVTVICYRYYVLHYEVHIITILQLLLIYSFMMSAILFININKAEMGGRKKAVGSASSF